MPEGILAGTSAYWRAEGTGARRAILLHCTFAHSGAWKALMAELADQSRMEAFDLPGHGRSGGRDMSQSWQSQSVAMAVDLIKMGDSPVDLVGHSFGATVALRLSKEQPDLVRSLTLIEPVFFSAARDAGHPEYEAHKRDHSGFIEHLKTGEFERAAREFTEMWGGPVGWAQTPPAQKQYMIERMSLVRDSSDAALGIGPDYISLDRFSGLQKPVLLVEGDQSNPIIAAVQQSLDAVLPCSRRVIVKGAGHMVPITHPAEVATAILAFWAKN